MIVHREWSVDAPTSRGPRICVCLSVSRRDRTAGTVHRDGRECDPAASCVRPRRYMHRYVQTAEPEESARERRCLRVL